jgi:transposase
LEKMSRVELKLLRITREEIDFALEAERRSWARKRLVAVREVLGGSTELHAAKVAKVSCGSVQRYLRRVRESGFASLVYDGRIGRRSKPMRPPEINKLREEISGILERKPSRKERRRLLAVDAVLAGNAPDKMAAEARVTLNTLRSWVAVARKRGMRALLRKSEGKPRRCH